MVHLVKLTPGQAQRPEFRSPEPTLEARHDKTNSYDIFSRARLLRKASGSLVMKIEFVMSLSGLQVSLFFCKNWLLFE